jgi:uncharacterized protein YmfQ (DUF2313 family)
MADPTVLEVSPGLVLEVEGDSVLQVSPGSLNPVLPPQAPIFGPADFAAARANLLPRGRAWPKFPAAVQMLVMAALAGTYVRSAAAAAQLIFDAFPATTVALISEWEESLGLPDPCAGPAPTLQQRQAQVVQRLANTGGASVPYLVGVLGALGYPVTITEFTGAQAHHFQVNAPTISRIYFRAGASCAGEPLVTGGNAVLECVINEIKPAHTTVSFVYG